eukprot:m.454802 g.454802  ORF g.454802 m.454802 type:complete len:299 (-) comp56954_c0_seq39:108-1004(-)
MPLRAVAKLSWNARASLSLHTSKLQLQFAHASARVQGVKEKVNNDWKEEEEEEMEESGEYSGVLVFLAVGPVLWIWAHYLHTFVSWLLSTSFTKYDIQAAAQKPSKELLAKLDAVTWWNSVFVTLPYASLMGVISAYGWGITVSTTLPSILELFKCGVVFLVLEEIGFYSTHRFLHSFRYASIHKIHHEFKAPVAQASVYCHPFEHLLANSIPVWLGPMFMRAHIVTLFLWFTMVVWTTCYDHSGKRLFSFGEQPDFHDFHHSNNIGNFGVTGVLDWLLGTDRAYRNWKAKAAKAQTN